MPTKPVITDPHRVVTRCPMCQRPYAIRTLGARGGPRPVCSEMCHDVLVAWGAFQKAFGVLLHARDWHGSRWLGVEALLGWRGKLFGVCSTRPWNEKGTRTKNGKAQPLLDEERLGRREEESALVEAIRAPGT